MHHFEIAVDAPGSMSRRLQSEIVSILTPFAICSKSAAKAPLPVVAAMVWSGRTMGCWSG
jgi:hypothetical protein